MPASQGILGKFKNNIKETIRENSKGFSAEKALLYVAYVIVAFVLGFVAKNYGKYLLIMVLSIAIAFWLSDYFNLININHDYVKKILGLQNVHSIKDCCYLLIQFIKSNIILNIICVISFIIGWKIG